MRRREFENLLSERDRCIKEIARMEKIIEHSPQGRLEHRDDGGYNRYRVVTGSGNSKTRRYLGASDRELIERLGNKAFARRTLPKLKKNLKALNLFAGVYTPDIFERIYGNLSDAGIPVSRNLYLSDSQKGVDFMNRIFERENPIEISEPIVASCGLVVRSKSEAIIADCLTHRGIKFRYEASVRLNNGGYLYPDFTLYFPEYDLIILWEHFGMMDDENYADRTCKKIKQYNDSGFVMGSRLIITMETSNVPLSPIVVNGIIDELLAKM